MPNWSQVKLLVLDFDGVLTDCTVFLDIDGREFVQCHHRDGQGIKLIREAGISVVVISGQESPYVARRCEKMKIDGFHDVRDKVACLEQYLAKNHPNIHLQDICFVGDDISDIPLLNKVGLPVAVADATPTVKAVAQYVTSRPGGREAVREVCDLILSDKN